MLARKGALGAGAGVALLAALVALAPSIARAQDDDGDARAAAAAADAQAGHEAPREAIELFQRAREEYQHGQYDQAASDLGRALVLDPGSPTLLYNLARVYELSGDLERAIGVYRQYLRVIPDQAERERTELTIQRLQGAQSYQRPDEDVYSQPLYVQQHGVADELFWTVLIGGGVVTLGAAILGITSLAMYDDATRFTIGADGEYADRQAYFDEVSSLSVATDVVGGIGAATLVASVLLFALRERTVEMFPDASHAAVAIAPDPRGGISIVVGGTL